MVAINWLVVVLGTVGYQVLGALWYGPLFGTLWMDAMDFEDGPPTDNAMLGYVVTGVGALVATGALAVLIDMVGASTWQDGLLIGLLAGIGFVATTAVQSVPFEGRSSTVYAINVGYNVVALAGLGVLLAVWWGPRVPPFEIVTHTLGRLFTAPHVEGR